MLPRAYVPTGQASQQSLTELLYTASAPLTSAVPTGQATSRTPSTFAVQVTSVGDQQSDAETDSSNDVVPGGHDVHSVLPDVSEYLPAGQGEQGVIESSAPSNWPGAQGSQ
eukprot:COSAG02_NODE_12821_length_1487_cov_1.652017_2_plen_110_part_01